MDRSLTQYNFTTQEHPTSVKWNSILALMEEVRKNAGPISLSAIANSNNSDTAVYLKVEDNIEDIGFGLTDGGMIATRLTAYRLFTVTCITSGDEPDHSGYVRWENVPVVSGTATDGFTDDPPYPWFIKLADSAWSSYAYIASGELGGGAGQLSASGASIATFTCIPQPFVASGTGA